MGRVRDRLLSPEWWAYLFSASAAAGLALMAFGHRSLGRWLCLPLAAYLGFAILVVVPILLVQNGCLKRKRRAS